MRQMAETFKINRGVLLAITPALVYQKTHAALAFLCLFLADYCHSLFEKINKNSRNSSLYKVSRQATSEDTLTLTPWRVIGSKLSSVICYLKNEAGMSYRKIPHALFMFFGISLSLG